MIELRSFLNIYKINLRVQLLKTFGKIKYSISSSKKLRRAAKNRIKNEYKIVLLLSDWAEMYNRMGETGTNDEGANKKRYNI